MPSGSLRAARHPPQKAGQALHYLVNDSRARPPEAHAILGTCSCQEIIHFLVYVLLKQINTQRISDTVCVWADPCSRPPPTQPPPRPDMLALWRQALSRGLLQIAPKGLAGGPGFRLAGLGEKQGSRDRPVLRFLVREQVQNKFLPCRGLSFLICRRS